MEINNIQRVAGVNPYRKDNNKTPPPPKKGRSKDEVQISPEAQQLLNAQSAQGTQGTDSRQQRIEALKQAVSTGTYQVDSGKLAEKLLPYLDGNE